MRLAVLLLGSALLLGACSPYTQHGLALYHEGRYVEAAEVFEVTEPRLASAAASSRAQYGVYRGLTFLRLDDLDSAGQWLGYAMAVERQVPGSLDGYDRSLLGSGLEELGRREREKPSKPTRESRVAATDVSASPRPAAPRSNGHRSIAPQ